METVFELLSNFFTKYLRYWWVNSQVFWPPWQIIGCFLLTEHHNPESKWSCTFIFIFTLKSWFCLTISKSLPKEFATCLFWDESIVDQLLQWFKGEENISAKRSPFKIHSADCFWIGNENVMTIKHSLEWSRIESIGRLKSISMHW